MTPKKRMFEKKVAQNFFNNVYRVQRADVSWAVVRASSKEEALEIANNNPDLWDINIGDTEVFDE
jgi:hypothetical protein